MGGWTSGSLQPATNVQALTNDCECVSRREMCETMGIKPMKHDNIACVCACVRISLLGSLHIVSITQCRVSGRKTAKVVLRLSGVKAAGVAAQQHQYWYGLRASNLTDKSRQSLSPCPSRLSAQCPPSTSVVSPTKLKRAMKVGRPTAWPTTCARCDTAYLQQQGAGETRVAWQQGCGMWVTWAASNAAWQCLLPTIAVGQVGCVNSQQITNSGKGKYIGTAVLHSCLPPPLPHTPCFVSRRLHGLQTLYTSATL